MLKKILVASISVIIFCGCLLAQAPNEIRYNGRVKELNNNVDGTKTMNFKLYNKETGGTAVWESGNQSITVKNGIFSYTLSPDVTRVDWSKGPYYLEIEIENYKLSPREKLTSVPYSLCSENGIPKGGIIIWSGSASEIPDGWALCDGTNGTPDLRDRFVVGAGNSYSIGDTGGEATHTLTIDEIPDHVHGMGVYGSNAGKFGSFSVQQIAEFPGNNSTEWNGNGSKTLNASAKIGVTNLATSFIVENEIKNADAHENMPPYYSLCYIMRIK